MSDHSIPNIQTAPGCCTASTMLGAIATSFAFCFILMVLFLYVRFLVIQRGRRRAAGALQQEEQPKSGLDPAVIAQLPSFPYKSASKDDEYNVGPSTETESTSPECAICLSFIEEGEQVRLLPSCQHLFHRECIDVWLSTNASCPVCRADPQRRNSELDEQFANQVRLDVHGEGVSSSVSRKERSSGEIERVNSTRSEWRHLYGDHAAHDLERQP